MPPTVRPPRWLCALAAAGLLALAFPAAAQEAQPEAADDPAAETAQTEEGAEDAADRDWPGDPLVAQIQQGLMDLGYEVSVVDGLMGPNTRTAIEAFQKDHGLTPTGEATDSLKRAIARAKFQRTQEAKRLWAEARRYLRALGYEPGDGGFDSDAAQAALKRFADDHWLQLERVFNERLAEVIERAARADAIAQERLCRHHMDAEDYAKAHDWCLRAARNGDAEAQYIAGWLSYYGKGTPLDYGAAFKWYRKAALNGDTRAMTFLGLMYRKGLGVERDPDRALSWYERAVEEGKRQGLR